MYTISKKFTFDAAHHLEGLPPEHKCSKVHGHTYEVLVEFKKQDLDEVGFVIDYRALEPIKAFLDDAMDHKDLNDFLPCNPTAENIAKFLFDTFKKSFPELSAVSVSETPKTVAIYTEE